MLRTSNIIPTAETVTQVFYQKRALKDFEKFTGKHLCWSLFFDKVANLRPGKKRLWYRCFHVNFAKFLRTPFYRAPPEDCFFHAGVLQKIHDYGLTRFTQLTISFTFA